MQWIEASFRTHSQDIDALCEKLTELGADGLVIEDEADFRRFLEENRQYWDYVDDELEARYRGVSRVKLYVEDSPEGARGWLPSQTARASSPKRASWPTRTGLRTGSSTTSP